MGNPTMRTHLSCALLALASAAQAALPTSGLASGDYPLAAHVSGEAFAGTKLGKALELAQVGDKQNADLTRKVKDRLGLDLNKDLRDITLQAKMRDGAPSLSGLIRGKFDKSKIEGFAASRKVAHKTVAGVKAWDLSQLVAQASDANLDAEEKVDAHVVILDNSTLILASEAEVAGAVAAAKANLPWKHAGLAEAVSKASNAWLVVAADIQALEKLSAADDPDATPSGAKTGNIGLGEDARNLQVRINADFVSEAKAKDSLAQLQGLLGFAQLGLLPNEEDSPEEAANKRDLATLVRGLKAEGSGSKLSVSLDYPVEKAIEALLKALAEGKAQAAGTAPKGK
jgi:hypothetical protein